MTAYVIEVSHPDGKVNCVVASTAYAARMIAAREASKVARNVDDSIQMRDRIKRHAALCEDRPGNGYSAHRS